MEACVLNEAACVLMELKVNVNTVLSAVVKCVDQSPASFPNARRKQQMASLYSA